VRMICLQAIDRTRHATERASDGFRNRNNAAVCILRFRHVVLRL